MRISKILTSTGTNTHTRLYTGGEIAQPVLELNHSHIITYVYHLIISKEIQWDEFMVFSFFICSLGLFLLLLFEFHLKGIKFNRQKEYVVENEIKVMQKTTFSLKCINCDHYLRIKCYVESNDNAAGSADERKTYKKKIRYGRTGRKRLANKRKHENFQSSVISQSDILRCEMIIDEPIPLLKDEQPHPPTPKQLSRGNKKIRYGRTGRKRLANKINASKDILKEKTFNGKLLQISKDNNLNGVLSEMDQFTEKLSTSPPSIRFSKITNNNPTLQQFCQYTEYLHAYNEYRFRCFDWDQEIKLNEPEFYGYDAFCKLMKEGPQKKIELLETKLYGDDYESEEKIPQQSNCNFDLALNEYTTRQNHTFEEAPVNLKSLLTKRLSNQERLIAEGLYDNVEEGTFEPVLYGDLDKEKSSSSSLDISNDLSSTDDIYQGEDSNISYDDLNSISSSLTFKSHDEPHVPPSTPTGQQNSFDQTHDSIEFENIIKECEFVDIP